MLAQIPEMTMTGRIPLEFPAGPLFALLLLVMLVLAVATETHLLDAVRARVGRRPAKLQRGQVATAGSRG